MRWQKKADEVSEAVKEERRDDARLRESVAVRQHDLERRLRLAMAQGRALKGIR